MGDRKEPGATGVINEFQKKLPEKYGDYYS
jgi:hypothetical protein